MADPLHNMSLKGIIDAADTDDGSPPNVAAVDPTIAVEIQWNNLNGVPDSVMDLQSVPPGTVVPNLNADMVDGYHAAPTPPPGVSTVPVTNPVTNQLSPTIIPTATITAHQIEHQSGGSDALSGTLDVNISGNAATATVAYYAP